MQLTVKIDAAAEPRPAEAVRRLLEQVRPDLAACTSVDEVFPGLAAGRRAGLVVVTVEAQLETSEVATLVHSLRARKEVVYVEVAAPREGR